MTDTFTGTFRQHTLLCALCPFVASVVPRPEASQISFDSETEKIVFAMDEFESRSELMDFCANQSEQEVWNQWREEVITTSELIRHLGVHRAKEINFFLEYRQVVHDLVDCIFVPSFMTSTSTVQIQSEDQKVSDVDTGATECF
eukprot:Blabericola_migrator_1__3569@NODE_205_length_11429_cov_258_680338_g176_i0_p6_GENE_NODE_205_length_11429_cov_258_680338_g176_i0NODE_205_length_11429_cov_258_680338_g176_i0_p6_ORF_typecomplete_len144_score23_26BBS1/PF14779_6/0_18_NODE_205_length_11429_cov_258_680338_g176_i094219852